MLGVRDPQTADTGPGAEASGDSPIFTACYDLAKSPPQYDALAFALYTNAVLRKQGYTRARVIVSPGAYSGNPRAGQTHQRLLQAVCVPILRMMPAEVEIGGCSGVWGCGVRGHGFDRYVDGIRYGGRSLRPLTKFDNDPVVTITLREAEHYPERNSNVAEWLKAAIALKECRVVFIRDTAKAAELLPGFATDIRAAYDLDYRGALYRSAFMNMGVSNGPMWFSIAIDAPTLIFKPTTENLDWTYTRAFFIEHGIKDQLPDNPPHQRIVWADDTADAIVNGFRAYAAANS